MKIITKIITISIFVIKTSIVQACVMDSFESIRRIPQTTENATVVIFGTKDALIKNPEQFPKTFGEILHHTLEVVYHQRDIEFLKTEQATLLDMASKANKEVLLDNKIHEITADLNAKGRA